jgi:hypothetical protein
MQDIAQGASEELKNSLAQKKAAYKELEEMFKYAPFNPR